MARRLPMCPDVNSPEFKNLSRLVGDNMAHAIWNAVEGNVDKYGIPLVIRSSELTADMIDSIHDARNQLARELGEPGAATDPNVRRNMFSGKDEVTVGEILENLHRENPKFRKIVNALRSVMLLSDANFKVRLAPVNLIPSSWDEGGLGNALGLYDPSRKEIVIAEFGAFRNSKDGLSHNTIIHEVVHLLSVEFLFKNPDSKQAKEFQKIYDAALSGIMEKYSITEEEAKKRFYGLTNPMELLSEGFARTQLIGELLRLPSATNSKTSDSLFHDIYEWLKSIYSVFKDDNLYNDFLASAEGIFRVSGIARAESQEDMTTLEEAKRKFLTGMEYIGGGIYEDKSYSPYPSSEDFKERAKQFGYNTVFSKIIDERGRTLFVTRIYEESYAEEAIKEAVAEPAVEVKAPERIIDIESDYLIKTSDGAVISTAEKAVAVGAIKTVLFDRIQKGARDVNINEVIDAAYNGLNNHYDTVFDRMSKASVQEDIDRFDGYAASLEKILDKTAWTKMAKIAVKEISKMGIKVSKGTISDNTKEAIDNEVRDEESTDASLEYDSGGFYDEDWGNDGQFSVGELDTASRNIKIMLTSFVDPTISVIGKQLPIDHEEAFRKILNVMTLHKYNSLDEMMDVIESEAANQDRSVPGNIFRQLHTKLEGSDFQTKVQFFTATNKNRNTFIMNMWKNFKEILTFNSEVKSAERVVQNEWKSVINFTATTNGRANVALFKKAAGFMEAARHKANSGVRGETALQIDARRNQVISNIDSAFKTLGIRLNSNTLSALKAEATYEKRNGNTFSNTKGLNAQFGYSTGGAPVGIFSAIEKIFNSVGPETSIDDIGNLLDDNALNFMSVVESKNSKKYFANMTRGVDGNAHWNFGFHTAQTRIAKLLSTDAGFVVMLKNSIFTNHASWLSPRAFGSVSVTDGVAQFNTNAFRNAFRVCDVDGIRKAGTDKAKTRKEMALSEDFLSKAGRFQNGGKDIMYVDGATNSDKKKQTTYQLPRQMLDRSVISNGAVKKSVLVNPNNLLLEDAIGIAKAEAQRIFEVRSASKATQKAMTDKNGKHYVNNSQFFFGYKELNTLLRFDNNMQLDLDAETELGGVKMKVRDMLVGIYSGDANHIAALKSMVADIFISEVEADVKLWEENGLIKRDKTGAISEAPIDKGYAEKAKLNLKDMDSAVRFMLLDMNMNATVVLHNEAMLISGDFAQMNKSAVDFILDAQKRMESRGLSTSEVSQLKVSLGIDDVMAEFQKRLASNIAPSRGVLPGVLKIGKRVLKDTYRTVFITDMKPDFATYAESLDAAAGVSASDLKADGSDALEWVTLKHKLECMLRDGAISDTEFTAILDEYNDGKGTLSDAHLQMVVIGAGKPLQVDYKVSKILGSEEGTEINILKKTYVKSAEMPLIAQVTRSLDGPIDGLRIAMEQQGVDRIAHLSATKMGAEHLVNIYDESNNLKTKEDIAKLFSTNKANESRMSWEGFGYQLDMHSDEEGAGVSMSTQADKTLFDGVLNEEFTHKGEKGISGRTLLERKNSILLELQLDNEGKLDAELGYNSSTGSVSSESVIKVITENADKLKWNNNDVLSAISAIRSGVPLMFAPISAKIESLISSLYTNRVLKHKMNGFAFVQFPHLGKKKTIKGATATEVEAVRARGGVVMTSEYDPSTGLKYSRSVDGKVHLMEIMVPFKFWSANKMLNPNDFADENGLISMDKLDPALLNIIGLRIPNQSHPSQVLCKIVGFLPRWAGDQCLVPPEITIQMGSDFDIDKLYTYWKNGFVSADGKLVSFPDNIVVFDKEQRVSVNEKALSSWRNKTFKNALDKQREVSEKIKQMKAKGKNADYIKSLTKTTEYTTTGWVDVDEATSTDDRAVMWESVLKDLGYTVEDLFVPSMKSLARKAMEDSYFEIFESVLGHPAVIKRAMQPLDAKDLGTRANESMSFVPKRNFGSYVRQSEDYISQSGAQSGVSVYSKNVPGLVLMEDKGIEFLRVDDNGYIISESGKVDSNPFTKFADANGAPINLSFITPAGISYHEDNKGEKKRRSGIKNVIIQQSGAVDNAKDPVLHKNNMNIKTFGVSALISAMSDKNMQSVSLDTNTRYLRQPAIKMLATLLRESDSSVLSYGESENKYVSNAVKTIINRISKPFDLAELTVKVSALEDHSYSPAELLELEQGVNLGNIDYVAAQIDLLKMYEDLDTRAWLMSDVVTMASLDSKGMQPSFYDNELKMDQVSRAISSEKMSAVGLMWSRDGSMKVSRSNGKYKVTNDSSDKVNPTGNGVRVAAKGHTVIGNLMGYTDSFINGAIEMVENTKGVADGKITIAMANTKKAVAKALKSYIYAKIDFLKGVTLDNLVNNSKVAGQLITLKKDPKLASNIFVQTLQVVKDNKHLEMHARTVDGPMSENLIRGFYELAMSENESYREFAANIVKYELLIGGIQGPQSALKYVAQDILDIWGINKQIADVHKSLTSAELSGFHELFFRNNPEEAKFIETSGADIVKFNIDKDSPQYVGDEKFNKLLPGKEGAVNNVEFIRSVDDQKQQVLYRLNIEKSDAATLRYDRVSRLGAAAINGHTPRKFTNYAATPSTIVSPSLRPIEISNPVIPSVTDDESEYAADFLMAYVTPGNPVIDLGTTLFRLENSQSKWVGGIMRMMGEGAFKGAVLYEDNSPDGATAAEYKPATGNIHIYRKEMGDGVKVFGSEYAFEVLTHEAYHAVEHNAYELGKAGQEAYKPIYNNVNAIFNDAKKAIKNEVMIGINTGEPIVSESGRAIKWGEYLQLFTSAKDPLKAIESLAKGLFIHDIGKRNEFRATLYSFSNPEEFMANLNSKVKFQAQMDKIKISESTAKQIGTDKNKSLLRALLDQFAKLFSEINPMFTIDTLGRKSSVNSVLEASFINQAILIDITATAAPVKAKQSIDFNPTNIPTDDRAKMAVAIQNSGYTIAYIRRPTEKELGLANNVHVEFTNGESVSIGVGTGSTGDLSKIEKASGLSDFRAYIGLVRMVEEYIILNKAEISKIYTGDSAMTTAAKDVYGKNYDATKDRYRSIGVDMSVELTGTIAEFLRGSKKDVKFAFRKALSKGLFKTHCE